MIYNYTSQGDVLDILFANRNKTYGAYLLRRTYPGRLKKSVGIMVGVVVVFSVCVEWKNSGQQREQVDKPLMPEFRGHTVKLSQPPEQPLLHPQVNLAEVRAVPRQSNPADLRLTFTPPVLVDDPAVEKLLPSPGRPDNGPVGSSTSTGESTGTGSGPYATGAFGAGTGSEENTHIDPVEVMPSFPGGEAALKRFFMRYLQTPDELGAGEQVKVLVHFVVDKDGSISAFAVDQSGGLVFDEEVIRVVKKMPKWNPGIQNGRPVAVYFRLPVTFMKAAE
jgi:periplasmic protein TonB